MKDSRDELLRALGVVEHDALQSEFFEALRMPVRQHTAEAFTLLSNVVGMSGGENYKDFNGNDCRIHAWRKLAVTAIYAVAQLSYDSRQRDEEDSHG